MAPGPMEKDVSATLDVLREARAFGEHEFGDAIECDIAAAFRRVFTTASPQLRQTLVQHFAG